ncbi:MAG TPA: CBS domain-containing protein [Blastocatellia bacterium]|nr:CBS domain-containing protein [Blastocatellia bacterium]
MGEHVISQEQDNEDVRLFTKSLLADIYALEQMLETGRIESGVRRIGAEQELFLIDHRMRPAPISLAVLRQLNDPRFTTEIAQFNLEANLSPQLFEGGCFSALEQELRQLISAVRRTARNLNADVLLSGILPTLRLSDLELSNLTPCPRYFELNRVVTQLRGDAFNFYIKGLDELQITHKNVMLESCNTSFQVHLQVGPEEFARFYNIVQAATAPVLAAAVNSPLLLGNRLWHETRLALFQQSVDERSAARQVRGTPTRVSFGDKWIDESVLEIFRDEIARFRIIMTTKIDEDPFAVLAQGGAPDLSALRLHNSTVWRWNRPCYGVTNGRAHLRIENRVLPSGPTIQDEIANAAFLLGLTVGMEQSYGDITKKLEFDDAKSNLFAAARYGLKAQLAWFDGKCYSASSLIKDELLPIARVGLEHANVDVHDIDRYLGIIENRVSSGQTGAQWVLQSRSALGDEYSTEVKDREIVAAMLDHQLKGEPVHQWPVLSDAQAIRWSESYEKVGQFMKTDLFTVRPDDLVNLAASVMNWRHIRHIPVEDDEGNLVGLVTHRDLMRLLERSLNSGDNQPIPVRAIMKLNPETATPEMPALEAIQLMRRNKIGCLPVVSDGRLVGIVTSYDFLDASAKLFEDQLSRKAAKKSAS